MADTNLSSVANGLKRRYADFLEHQQNLKHRAIDEIGKSLDKLSPGGEGFFGGIELAGNESIGAINEEETFRSIDSELYAQYKVVPKINVAPIQFSGLVSEAAKGDDESFANLVVEALERARERLLKDENRQFYGYGKGVLAQPAQTTNSTYLSFTVDTTQYIRPNAVVDIMFAAGDSRSLASGLRVTDVDRVNNIIFLTTSILVSISAGNVIVKENIGVSAPADGKEMMGLRGIVDDSTDLTTFQNLSAAASGQWIWRALRISASSANLTSDLLQRLLDGVHNISGEDADTIIMHQFQRRKYLDIVVPQKRYMDEKMDTGFKKLEFNGTELWLDNDCQTDTVYAIQKKKIKKFELKAMHMGAHDGSDVFLRLSRQDVFQAYWRHYSNFGTSRRNVHGKLVSLATPSGVA